MAEYLPPTENVALFDTLNFNDGDTPLTYNKAVKYFLRYPVAQGTETLQNATVNSTLSVDTIAMKALSSVVKVYGEGTVGNLATGTLEIANGARSGTITINNSSSSTAPTVIGGAGSSSFISKGNLTLTGGASNTSAFATTTTTGTIDIATAQTTGALNIGTGGRSGVNGINIGTGATSSGGVFIGKLANQAPVSGSTVIEGVETQGVYVGNKLTTGAFEIGQNQTSGKIRIGFGASRTALGSIEIGNNASSLASVSVGAFTLPAPSSTNQTITANANTVGFDNANAVGNCTLYNSSSTGTVTICNTQTQGRLQIGTSNRSNLGTSLQTGIIEVGTGSATGANVLGVNYGVELNIGTGARTVYSNINIGTGTRDNTCDINIGTSGTNAGHLHLQDGNANSGNVHIANGTSNTGNVNICNNGGTGVINMGALGRAVEFSTTYTQANNEYKLGWYDLTTSTFFPTGTTVTMLCQTAISLPAGIWLVCGYAGWQTTTQVLRTISISTTLGVHDTINVIGNFNALGANGGYRTHISAVVQLASASKIYLLGSNNTTSTGSAGSNAMTWTRIG